MSDWSHGYNVSTGYTYGFYREMALDWLDFCTWIGGWEPPERQKRATRYLELGSGQGFGLCLLAAANPRVEFVGIDFQPEHIEHSVQLAEAAELSNVRFVQADFLHLAADWPQDLGTFDYVTLHGTLSWVSSPLHSAIVQCLAHATAPRGIVYVSYNAQPGCLSTIPLQHFSRRFEETHEQHGAAAAVDESIALLEGLASAKAPVFQALPALKERLAALKKRDKAYLVHEYLTESWNIFWPSEVARDFRRANLEYVASATLADNLVREFLPPPMYRIVAEQKSEELGRDLEAFIVNQAFRRDVFCRGPVPRANSAAMEALRVYLAASVEPTRSLNFETSFGHIAWEPAVFTGIIKSLETGPKALGQLFRLPNSTSWKPRHILLLLLHATVLAPEAAVPGEVAVSERFNAAVARAVCDGAPYRAVAAAALGSGVSAADTDLMLLDAWFESQGNADVTLLAEQLESRLSNLRRSLGGEPLHGAVPTTGARQQASTFIQHTLPRWRQLGVLQ